MSAWKSQIPKLQISLPDRALITATPLKGAGVEWRTTMPHTFWSLSNSKLVELYWYLSTWLLDSLWTALKDLISPFSTWLMQHLQTLMPHHQESHSRPGRVHPQVDVETNRNSRVHYVGDESKHIRNQNWYIVPLDRAHKPLDCAVTGNNPVRLALPAGCLTLVHMSMACRTTLISLVNVKKNHKKFKIELLSLKVW